MNCSSSDQPPTHLIHITLHQLTFIPQSEKYQKRKILGCQNMRKNIPAKLNTVLLEVSSDCLGNFWKYIKSVLQSKSILKKEKNISRVSVPNASTHNFGLICPKHIAEIYTG
jgi:hypothetical protein